MSFGSLFGSLIGTDLIIAKIYAFANAKREEFAEMLRLFLNTIYANLICVTFVAVLHYFGY